MLLIFLFFINLEYINIEVQTRQSIVQAKPSKLRRAHGHETTTSCQHTPVRPPEVPESPRSKPPPGLVPDLSPGRARTTGHAAGETEEMAAADSATASSSSSSPECPAAPSMPTDPDFLSCVLQPPTSSSSRPDADYAALRRLLLRRKPPSALQHRMVRRRTPAS